MPMESSSRETLGICSSLAVTVQLQTAIVMSLALTFVVAFSNLFISLLRNQIRAAIPGLEWQDEQEWIETALQKLGLRRDKKPFKPHLTIARVRGGGPALDDLAHQIQANQTFDAGTTLVTEVTAFASILDPKGAKYEVLGRAPLNG